MTETDISKVLIEGEYATIMGVKYKRVEEPKSPVAEAYKVWWGQYPELETDSEYDDMRWQGFQAGYEAGKKGGKYAEPYCPDEPEYYDEVECDEKDNPKPRSPLDEIVDEMVKEHQAQKLYNRLYDELGYVFGNCDEIVDLVEDWLPKEQSAAGSQNVNTELLVEGFNDCIQKMKGMLR